MNLDHYGVQKMVRAMAEQQGMRLVFETDRNQPRTDGSTIYVPAPSPEMDKDQSTLWQYYVYHEIGHCVPGMRDWLGVNKKYGIQAQSFLGSVMNILDDYRQEKYKIDEYQGRKAVMSKGRYLFMKQQLDNLPEPENKEHACFMSLFCFDAKARESWMKDMVGMGDLSYSKVAPEVQKYADKLLAGDYTQELNAAVTAEDLYTLSTRILKEVFELDPEEAKQQPEGVEQGGEQADGKAAWEDLLFHKHDPEGSSYAGLEIDYSSYDAEGTYIPYSESEITLVQKQDLPRPEHMYDMYPVNSTLSSQVQRLLRIYSKANYEFGKKKGAIANRNLHRLRTGNTRVFKKKHEKDVLDTAVTVLVDYSGSMGGRKMQDAVSSALMLNNAISVLDVPLEILGFTEGDQALFYEIKPFGAKVSEQSLSSTMAASCRAGMGLTIDPDALLYAYSRLIRQQSKKKIIIVLSDGQPGSHKEGDIRSFMKQTVRSIEQSGVDLYSIGIQSDAVRDYYKNYAVLQDSRDLERTLLNIVKTHIIGE